ncbi:MAG: pantoate--beta-alanine ligase [Nitrospirota bacterium]|jgi:pantoate--beta-alanine ligase
MKAIHSAAILRDTLHGPRYEEKRIGLVPTMGAFHAGHLSLMREAKEEHHLVVVSLFVNPTQFDDPEDLDRYPRTLVDDMEKAEAAGVDILFHPTVEEIYPEGFDTRVEVGEIAGRLEGEGRPGHFTGVATVVAKLLNIVQPHTAYFGLKDYQQSLVVRRMVADLNLPVEVVCMPTVREPDGLAMSSRNQRLDPDGRTRAAGLYEVLGRLRDELLAADKGAPTASIIEAGRMKLEKDHGLEVEYLLVAHPDTLAPLPKVVRTMVLLAAVRVGGVRLIDNVEIHRTHGGPQARAAAGAAG